MLRAADNKPARASVFISISVMVLVALIATACTSSHHDGTVNGQAMLTGRVPGHGQPLTVGAINDHGMIITAGSGVRPGGHFTLTVPPGIYRVGLWLPGTQLAASRVI